MDGMDFGDGGAELLISFSQNKAGSVARQSNLNEGKGSGPGSKPQGSSQVLIDACLGEQHPSEANLPLCTSLVRAQSFLSSCLQRCSQHTPEGFAKVKLRMTQM